MANDLEEKATLDSGDARRVPPPKVSQAVRAARAPRSPEELVGALQDRIHPTSGPLLAAKPIATIRGIDTCPFCEAGWPRVPSSVSERHVHITDNDRVICPVKEGR